MVVRSLPNWIMQRYARLWIKFESKAFTYEEASRALKEKDRNLPSVVLSYIKKCGWLSLQVHPDDSRKKIYTLKDPISAVKEIAQGEGGKK